MLSLKNSTGKLIVKKHLTDYVAQDSGKNIGYSVTLLLEMTKSRITDTASPFHRVAGRKNSFSCMPQAGG